MIKTAILVDGGFYKMRIQRLLGPESPQEAANTLYGYCMKHIKGNDKESCQLYRVMYYDCPPSEKQLYNPLTKSCECLKKTPLYLWNTAFLQELRSKRKFALRLGSLSDEHTAYTLREHVIKALLRGEKAVSDITQEDLQISVKQKGVDMRIGLDIASMAYKHQVDRIVLISGDSDFVPAAKLARREGIDFVLDPMWASINPQLHEHIDGLKSFRITKKQAPSPEHC